MATLAMAMKMPKATILTMAALLLSLPAVLPALASADWSIQVDLENTTGEAKANWPVVLPVIDLFGRDLPAAGAGGALNPKGFHVLDAAGKEVPCMLEALPPYEHVGNDELVFVVPTIQPGQKLTYRVSNTAGDNAAMTTIDLVGNPNNLMPNGGFEAGADGAIEGYTGKAALDTAVKRSGNSSLLLAGTREQRLKAAKPIALHAETPYYFGAWVKPEAVSRHALYHSRGAQFNLAGFHNGLAKCPENAKDYEKRCNASVQPTCATRDWHKVRWQMVGTSDWGLPLYVAKPIAETVTPEIVLDQRKQFITPPDKLEGKCWFDDAVLVAQPKVTVRFDLPLKAAMKDGLFVFTCPTNAVLGSTRAKYGAFAVLPFAHESAERLDRYGLRGQRVPYLLGLYHARPVKGVTVSVEGGALAGPDGAKIECAEVEYAPGFTGDGANHLLGAHDGPVDLPGEKGCPYFVVSFVVPRDAKAGRYAGTLAVQADGKAVKRLPVALRVQDMEMPIIRDRYVGMIFQGNKNPPFNEDGVSQYAKSGWSCVTTFFGFLPFSKDQDKRDQIDLVQLEQKLRWLKDKGITAAVCPFSDLDLGPLWGGGSLLKRAKTKEAYQAQVKRLEEFSAAHPDLPRIVYMTWDEPNAGTPYKYGSHGGPNPIMGWVNEVAPNAPTTLDAQFVIFDKIIQYYTMPAFDDPSNFCGPELYRWVKAQGKDFGFAAAATPSGDAARYQPGMMMIASGGRYMHAWHLNGGGNLMALVNGKTHRALGMVAAGEGMDDLKVHTLLARLIAEAKSGPAKAAAAKAQAYLDEIHKLWNADHAYAASTPYLGHSSQWGYDRFYNDWQERMARHAAVIKGVKWMD